MKNKYLYSIIAVLVVVLCFMSFSLYQTKKQAFGIFLNHFYFTIDRMVEGFVEMIDNNEDTDTLAFYLNRLHEDMQNANHLFYSNAFINEDMYYYFILKT
ncbi:MAG: hypothetical protein LRY71_10355 [Bacillaceae bacterium]|nr:hypothetical protein [Bacillaceae bacterium]